MAHETTGFQLPLAVVTVIDVNRIKRELDELNEFMVQSEIRKAGTQPALPRTSHTLDEVANQNDLNLLKKADRENLGTELSRLRKDAPVIHISFATDPPPVFLKHIITWFRREVNPELLLQVGLQPSIAAGCIVRTTSKYFDFSLRKHFEQQRQLLVDKLKESTS